MAPTPDTVSPPPPSSAGTSTGRQLQGSLEDHEARSALRSLVARVLAALDAGDGVAFASCFWPEGRWLDTSGATTGPEGLAGHLARWRAHEPWSVHWVSNEGVLVEGGRARGAWLWSAASAADGGEVPVWSGGDLVVEAERTDGTWRLQRLELRDRYRTSWERGWLDEPHRPIAVGPVEEPATSSAPGQPASSAAGPLPPSPEAVPSSWPVERRLAAMTSEVQVRNLVARVVGALELGRVDLVPELLAPEAVLVVGDGEELGGAALLDALGADAAAGAGLMRTLSSWWCGADGQGRAVCGWRELSTAVVDGAATWSGSAWSAEAVDLAGDGAWRLARLVRRDLLRSPYLPPWSVGPVVAVAR